MAFRIQTPSVPFEVLLFYSMVLLVAIVLIYVCCEYVLTRWA